MSFATYVVGKMLGKPSFNLSLFNMRLRIDEIVTAAPCYLLDSGFCCAVVTAARYYCYAVAPLVAAF